MSTLTTRTKDDARAVLERHLQISRGACDRSPVNYFGDREALEVLI
jgi:hypothetical protein